MSTIQEPLDLIRLALSETVTVKCRGERRLVGTLHAYDAHMNMVIGNAEESSLTKTGDDSAPVRTTRKMDMVFVRGDGVILVSTKPCETK